MERILMHKNTPVVAIRVCGRKIVAASVLNRSLLPVGTDTEYQQPQPHLLSAWNAMKSIPDTRQEITSLKDVLPLEHALENGHMASLTDCYWMAVKNQFQILLDPDKPTSNALRQQLQTRLASHPECPLMYMSQVHPN